MAQIANEGGEPIAIVGMSCTLAGGVDSPAQLWQTLINKEIKQSAKIPGSRFNIDAYFREDAFGRPSAIGSRGGFFLDTELHAFDAEFFGYQADEAKHMDPQHFRVLESVYECLESAGLTMDDVRGTKTAVYIGNFSLDQVIKSNRNSYDDRHLHEVIGVDPGLLSSRVSYCFDLSGPVFTTNTGCTSSLFALHTAAMALRSGECSSAIVGGVNLLQGPEAYSSYSKFGIMSPDSMCHSFDARCNGYVRAEGVGTLYVKLLSDAIRDNDPIRGVVRSIAVNSNGYVPGMPLFVPNEAGLKKSMKLAYAQANLDPAHTAYVETHGIGMILGELAEAFAIGQFMNEPTRRDSPMLVGSLKTNFGHQEAASGIFVLIKSAMMTEAGIIPAHAGFKSAHPKTDHEALNIKVQTENIPWPDGFPGRRVGLCSYGWSGTNAHILVEDVRTLHPNYSLGQVRQEASYDHTVRRPLLVTFSAFKSSSLHRNISKHSDVADKYYLADLAYTLNSRRSKFSERAFTVADEGDNTAFASSAMSFGTVTNETQQAKVAVACTNSSADFKTMAMECMTVFPSFSDTIRRLDDILEKVDSGAQIKAYILGEEVKSLSSNDLVDSLRSTGIQIALIDLLKRWNVSWDVVVKETGAEIIAAYAAGQLSASEAILLPLIPAYSASSLPDLDVTTRAALDEKIQKLGQNFPDWRLQTSAIAAVDAENTENTILLQFGSGSSSARSSKAISHTITSLKTLLQAAGQLYLVDHPVNLNQVNAIADVDWEPSVLVDLPSYQWDHSNSYSEENHANLEQRLNEHPYHDLLGRRVFGLAPHTMVWKNKLSFRDLPTSIPWTPNEKPLTVLGLSHFISMAVEAWSQVFGAAQLSDFAIHNFELLNVLRYAEDCDLIELQTSITKLPGGGKAKPMYGIGIESIKENVWVTHCEGTISVENDSQTTNGVNGIHESDVRTGKFTPQTKLPEKLGSKHQIHPSLIEACLELAKISSPGEDNSQTLKSPIAQIIRRVATIKICKSPIEKARGDWTVHASSKGGQSADIDIDVADESGEAVLKLEGVHVG